MVTQFFIWLGKTLATVAITVVFTLWLTGLMMTSVIQSVLKEYEIPLQVEPVIYSGILGYLWGYQNDKQLDSDIGSTINDQTISKTETLTASEAINKGLLIDPKQNIGETKEEEQTPSVDVLAPIELEEQLEISKSELGTAKDSLTEREKERLMQILVEKIPADQWQVISLYLEDGLSESELLETKQILAQHLNDEEYSELIAILKKS